MNSVVLIEDQKSIRDLLALFIRSLPGYEVVGVFSDGQDGLAQCLVLKPDIVVLDLSLPGRSGLEVVRTLIPQLPRTRVLVFSGRGSPKGLRDVFNAGALGYIDKTDGAEELRRGIEIVASGGTFIGPSMTAVLNENRGATPNEGAGKRQLTTRETEIVTMVAQGRSSREIADSLTLSVRTVENHRKNVLAKLNMRGVADLTRYAIEQELLSTFNISASGMARS